MKCRSAPREDSFKKEFKTSSPRGGRGKRLSFPQAELPILRLAPPVASATAQRPHLVPLGIDAEQDEIIQRIQVQVKSLNWTIETIIELITNRFNGKHRYQFSHDELVLLLYYLRTLSSE